MNNEYYFLSKFGIFIGPLNKTHNILIKDMFSVIHKKLIRSFFYLLILFSLASCQKRSVTIVMSESTNPRVQFGIEKLVDVLKENGYSLVKTDFQTSGLHGTRVFIGEIDDTDFLKLIHKIPDSIEANHHREGFSIKAEKKTIIIAGADATGVLYGCQELANRINNLGKIPTHFEFVDQPEMVLRGACIGLQKTTYLPGRGVYEYPYTPENFPWFYDKQLWIKYLDMLEADRMNALYLWNGHPFASLVRLKDYPFAIEVDDSTFAKNEEIFEFLTKEADKRGICVIQMFYNIIVSKPFAEHYGLKTQDRKRPIIPLIEDYTRKSIAAFIEKYPNVGLMVCLGEAMNTIEEDIEWFTGTIIPGVKDALKSLGRTDEPPLILRAHDTDAKRVMEAALPLYKNLYTMFKYNGESLTTYEPRGSWARIPQDLSKLGSVNIANVHILANLEPFRYGSPDFIQKSVLAMHSIQGANGLHLYPQASYWDWPYSADKTSPRLLEMDRDWIWYKAWGRYAWNCHRDSVSEVDYWSRELCDYYDCGKYGKDILIAYEQTGEIAPKLLRRFGISDGNRQTLLLGMFMSQLVNPYKWQVYSNFYSSNGPKGEILLEYAEKEWKHEAHQGETPPQIIREVLQHGKLAVEAIDKASGHIKKNRDEFKRLQNDVFCYNTIANFFAEKVHAALLVLRYKYSDDITDLEQAIPYLEKSLEYYKQLVQLTKYNYLYANSMQTKQRRIPISGADGKNKTWAELLPHYQEEFENFKRNVLTLKSLNWKKIEKQRAELQPAEAKLSDKSIQNFKFAKNQKIYSDKDYAIDTFAQELKNLTGLKLSFDRQIEEGTRLEFTCSQPVKVLVGFFNGNSYKILSPPTLETDANANDRGQADIRIANAIDIPGLYPVNIYTYAFESGKNVLQLGKGIVLIIGFIDGHQEITTFDACLGTHNNTQGIDWLFY